MYGKIVLTSAGLAQSDRLISDVPVAHLTGGSSYSLSEVSAVSFFRSRFLAQNLPGNDVGVMIER